MSEAAQEVPSVKTLPCHPTSPDRLFEEVRDFIARVDDGHATPETALARMIEHIARNNAMFITTVCIDAGVTVPCGCYDFD